MMSFPGVCLSRAISAMGSPAMILVFVHVASCNVDDTTHLVMELMYSLYGSPDRVGHVAANALYVCRPMRSASHENNSDVCISTPSWSPARPDGQVCGFAMTPSSVM